VLHYEPDTGSVTPVFLRLERCNGTVTWCRPPWSDPRRGSAGSMMGAAGSASSSASLSSGEDAGAPLDAVEEAVTPGLRMKYANRSGESLAYTDEG